MLTIVLIATVSIAPANPFTAFNRVHPVKESVTSFQQAQILGHPEADQDSKRKTSIFIAPLEAEELTSEGFRVNVSKAVMEGKELVFQIEIANYHREEAFIELINPDEFSYFIRSGSMILSGVGKQIGFPDNTRMLKRLHAASRNPNGDLHTCNCAIARIEGRIPVIDAFDQISVSFSLTGYFRSDGKKSSEQVKVPIQINTR